MSNITSSGPNNVPQLPRILQNQETFSTEEYRHRVTPLVVALERRNIPCWIRNLRSNAFFAGALMYLCADEFDVVVTVSHRPAMVFGLLTRLFSRRKALHVAKEFFFEGVAVNANSIKNQLLSGLYRFALANLDAAVVNATAEINAYARDLGLPKNRFIFIPWPSNISQPEMIEDSDGSIFAVGRSLRDWDTFFKAVEGLKQRCVVVASRADVSNLRVPANVELHCDIAHDKYLSLLQQSKIVVVPLLETSRSTGQASFLEAMAYGKPVIVAGVTGAWDYISNRNSGLLYRPGDVLNLRQTIEELDNDQALRNTIARGGLEAIQNRFNKQTYAQEMLATIDTLHASSLPS